MTIDEAKDILGQLVNFNWLAEREKEAIRTVLKELKRLEDFKTIQSY